jgi:enoyl-CoA hydratase/carnithine racemase
MSQPQTLPEEPILLREDDGAVARLTLNRPAQFNALSEEMLDALQATFDEIAETRAIRLVTIGARGKAFCAGHDLKQMRARPEQAYYEWLFRKCGRVMTTMLRLPQPVIARVQGIATAAGCQLVANCDLAVASEEARFATSGIGVGLFCFTPGVALSRNVGRRTSWKRRWMSWPRRSSRNPRQRLPPASAPSIASSRWAWMRPMPTRRRKWRGT